MSIAIDPEKNPWTVLSTRLCYENPWISIAESQVLHPGGQPGIYGTVHYKKIAVGVLPLDEMGNTWLVGQYRFTLNRYSWEIPEGGGEPGEQPVQAARRELQEETGLSAAHFTPLLQNLHLSNSVTDEVGFSFLARGLSVGASAPEACEQLQVRKLPFLDVCAMVERGEITDLLSVATIFKVRLMQWQGQL